MTVEEILEREAQNLGRPCELVEATELGEGEERVLVVLYQAAWIELPRGDGRMRDTRVAVHVQRGGGGATSLIVRSEFDREEQPDGRG